jgi:hypothetical protein
METIYAILMREIKDPEDLKRVVQAVKEYATEKQRGRGVACQACSRFLVVYMVRDELWQSVADRRDALCIRCFSERLGRKLTAADFTEAPCNDLIHALQEMSFTPTSTTALSSSSGGTAQLPRAAPASP